MRVLVTGGVGFIGQHLARKLVAGGHEVIALDALSPQVHAQPREAVQQFPGPVIEADVAETDSWRGLPSVDCIVHLAAETGTAQSMYEQERYERVNVLGTQLAARAAVQSRVPIISLSSRAVYGEGQFVDGEPQPSYEDDPHAPVSFYGETKSTAETVLVEETRGAVPAVIIRPQNVIGPGQALHNPYTGVLAAFLARLREGRSLSIYGDGTQTRDFVHVEDLADLIVWNIENPPGVDVPRVLNCGTGTRTTLTQLAEYAVAAAPHGSVAIEYVDVHRAGDIQHACADLRRLTELGAPLPKRTPQQAVADFIRSSWSGDVASSALWDDALHELRNRGLASET